MTQTRKQLFPCNTSKLAAMYETDEFYIITGEDECEMCIDKSSPTAELEAWIAYSGALDTAVHKRLRERPKTKSYLAELVKKVMSEVEDSENEIPIVQMPTMR